MSPLFPPAPTLVLRWARAHSNIVMFVAGFLFDVVTIQRIDSRRDLAMQLIYLLSLTLLIVLQHREASGLWTPPAFLQRWWRYSVDVLHFFYGGLLSAYVILYFRSSTGARPLVFLVLLVAVFVLNEVPHIRRAGHRLRLGLLAFCVLSFLNYFVPIVIGRMGDWVFAMAWIATLLLVWWLASHLASGTLNRHIERVRLFTPAALVCAAIAGLYLLRLIPPVPLSVTFQGIYHDVRRHQGGYTLVYERPASVRFWQHDSRPFRARSGDSVYYFLRVFAPARFSQRIFTRWEYETNDGWRTSDRIELPLVRGGRAEGYRTYARKSTFQPGRWRVTAETDDGRAMATVEFRVEADTRTDPRVWLAREG